MNMVNYNLPEWVILDGESHQGNTLKGRTVIQHIRTCTVLEVVPMDDVAQSNFETQTFEFWYKNQFGLKEQFLLAVHFTLAAEHELPDIFKKAQKWYCDYLDWEDRNIVDDSRALKN